MRVLLALTYYRPNVSGLTIYVERLGRALAERGHEVTVLTSRFDPSTPREEVVDGVRIVRVPVAMRVSKGVITPTLGIQATRLMRDHDVVSMHLPMLDAFGIALRARRLGVPSVLTYHCDLQLPAGPFNRVVDRVVHRANAAAARVADRVVAYTEDYASHSPLLRANRHKLEVIPPPVVMPAPTAHDVATFRAAHGLEGRRVLGMAARLATEKGVEFVLEAAPALLERYPDLHLLFAGPWQNVLGEEEYRRRLEPRIRALGDRWTFLGTLDSTRLPAFYGALDALLLTSINSTESFGLVQVEAMLCGTPVVVSDLPGVRQPVRVTGMGEVVRRADTSDLVDGITKVLDDRDAYIRPRAEIERSYDIEVTVASYENLFHRLRAARGGPTS